MAVGSFLSGKAYTVASNVFSNCRINRVTLISVLLSSFNGCRMILKHCSGDDSITPPIPATQPESSMTVHPLTE